MVHYKCYFNSIIVLWSESFSSREIARKSKICEYQKNSRLTLSYLALFQLVDVA